MISVDGATGFSVPVVSWRGGRGTSDEAAPALAFDWGQHGGRPLTQVGGGAARVLLGMPGGGVCQTALFFLPIEHRHPRFFSKIYALFGRHVLRLLRVWTPEKGGGSSELRGLLSDALPPERVDPNATPEAATAMTSSRHPILIKELVTYPQVKGPCPMVAL